MFNRPKNDANYHWTNHVMRKTVFYGLSAERIKRVIRNPERSEKGIAPDTIAVMQSAGNGRGHYEVWVMYAAAKPRVQSAKFKAQNQNQNIVSRKIIITAWRYPGTSPVREAIPIPTNILEELRKRSKRNEQKRIEFHNGLSGKNF